LICLSVSHSQLLSDVPKEQLLVHIAKDLLGAQLGMVASAAVFLACFTTSVALATVYADFVAEKIFGSQDRYLVGLMATQFVTYVMSITGLEGIAAVTEPILQLFYPMLMIMIVFNLARKGLRPLPEFEKSEEPAFD
jgi:LIVCS family branched-chain amino acid:cation transporter